MDSFYQRAVDDLFITIMNVVTLLAFFSLLVPMIDPKENMLNITSNLIFILLLLYTRMLFYIGKKVFAIHFFLVTTFLLFLVDRVVLGLDFGSMILIFPFAIIYMFIFFRRISIQIIYTLFGIACQFLSIFYLNKGNEEGFTDFIVMDFIYTIIYNAGVFGLCYFLMINLKRFQSEKLESKERNTENEVEH